MRIIFSAALVLFFSSMGDRAEAAYAVFSGGVTTTTDQQVPAVLLGRVTETNYFVIDRVSGAYQRIRIYSDNRVKKYAATDSGTLDLHAYPANARNTASNYVYVTANSVNNITFSSQIYDRTWLELRGLATNAAATSAGLPAPFPPLMTLVGHDVILRTFNQGGMMIVTTADRLVEETATLKLQTKLSKNVNDLAPADLAAAVVHVETYLHDVLHYSGGP